MVFKIPRYFLFIWICGEPYRLYTKRLVGVRFVSFLYVDDILLVTNNKGLLCKVKQFLFENFDMKDRSNAFYVMGIKIHKGIF